MDPWFRILDPFRWASRAACYPGLRADALCTQGFRVFQSFPKNSPGRRPNGVYDRFPLGGFTLLYGSLLGSSPPPRNFDSTKDFGVRPSGRSFLATQKIIKKSAPQFSYFLRICFSVFVIFPINSEPFCVNSGTPWASFFDVFLGYRFWRVFWSILSQISKKNKKSDKCSKHCACA